MDSNEQHTPERAVATRRGRPGSLRPRRIYSLIGAIAAVGMALLLAQALIANVGSARTRANAASQATASAAQLAPNPGQNGPDTSRLITPGGGAPGISYSAVAMVSPADGWLFGYTSSTAPDGGPCASCGPLIFHYDGAQWRRTPSPTTDFVIAASMLSSTDGRAITRNTILHYTGGAWTVDGTYSVPDGSIYLSNIVMASPEDGWIGGTDDGATTQTPLLLHYTGGEWHPVALPAVAGAVGINGISMLSRMEGWALEFVFIPSDGTEETVLLHYANGTWQRAGTPIAATLTGLSAVSPGVVWMVGSVTGITGGIFEYANGQVTQVASPTPNILHAITMLSPSDGWAVGDGAATLHWDGMAWTKVGFVIHGVALMGVSFPSAGEGWAEGDAITSGPYQQATLLHCRGGTWSVYTLKIGG